MRFLTTLTTLSLLGAGLVGLGACGATMAGRASGDVAGEALPLPPAVARGSHVGAVAFTFPSTPDTRGLARVIGPEVTAALKTCATGPEALTLRGRVTEYTLNGDVPAHALDGEHWAAAVIELSRADGRVVGRYVVRAPLPSSAEAAARPAPANEPDRVYAATLGHALCAQAFPG